MTTLAIAGISPATTPADMERSRAWAARYLADAAALPISFTYDGKVISGIPATWQSVARTRRIDANISESIFEGKDAQTGLSVRVECTFYHDYPVVEWVAWFTNQGAEATPLLSDVLAMNGSFEGAAPRLVHCNGDFYSVEGYTPQEVAISEGGALTFAPNGGRSCDGAFPYYRLIFAGGGVSLAIGWPGQWSATFNGQSDGVQVQAGQQTTHLRLQPGESIRTPRMTALFWGGDATRAVNMWRRWYLSHILPKPNGQPMQPHVACAASDEGEEFTAATEENQIRFMDSFRQQGIDFDVWWIDAGWYPCYNDQGIRRWPVTGTWEPDAERFPNGLKPISDHAARNNADLLLWFEPERVRPGTKLDREHPEWLLKIPENENGLLDLGNPACRQWLTDHVCQLIQDNGIKIYRQDHNFPPLQHWRKNEAEDRQGMNENLHVQGYLHYWDDLLARNPGLWIDSCASGGRRNDLETMRRSVPLHYTDYGYGDHPVKLAFHHTLYGWIPYFKEATLSWDIDGKARFDHVIDSYSYHCGFAPMLFVGLDIRRQDYDFDTARTMVGIWRRAADTLLFGDYYPLTPFHRSAQGWCIRQFDRPEQGRGFVQGIRFPQSSDERVTVYLQGIDAAATYLFENPETGERQEIAGEILKAGGLPFELAPRSGAIWFYQRKEIG